MVAAVPNFKKWGTNKNKTTTKIYEPVVALAIRLSCTSQPTIV